ncbi:MAG TPA: tRNA lysidine(34) synthetase TilS, partial [Bacteroidetes bacterium]|nr:tRNA lysidine(34) synthetase TilS [Bacteroidota bacterium]HEX04196.1 tRNA lysidine(34) synthetase TilS [Bacteroidota bacterium]
MDHTPGSYLLLAMVNRIQRNVQYKDLPDWDREGIVLSDHTPLKRGILFSRITPHLQADETILVAVSGGSDSMALLLLSLPPEQHRERLIVGHIHHGTGEFADQATALVERVCGELNVRLIVEYIEIVPDRKKEVGFEAAARELRYAALERIAVQCNAGRLLSGHTQDDLAETFLINAMRGAGLSGLAGLKPERGKWRRPLLGRTHEELRQFLEAESYPFIDDPANEDEAYTRVAVRRQLGELIREQFGAGHWANIARAAQHLHVADQALEIEAVRLAKSVIRRRTPGWVSIDAGELGGYLSELVIRVLRRILSLVRGCSIEDIYLDRKDRRHLLDMVRKPKTGQTIRVEGIRITDRGELEFSAFSSDTLIQLNLPGECRLPDGSRVRVDTESVNPSEEASV